MDQCPYASFPDGPVSLWTSVPDGPGPVESCGGFSGCRWTDPRHGLGRAPTAGLGALLLVWGPAACLGPGPAARQGPCCRSGALLLVLDGARLLQSFRADEYQGTREVRSCPAPESEKTQKPRYTSPKDIETHQSSSSVLF
jgi:hypothetical protein